MKLHTITENGLLIMCMQRHAREWGFQSNDGHFRFLTAVASFPSSSVGRERINAAICICAAWENRIASFPPLERECRELPVRGVSPKTASGHVGCVARICTSHYQPQAEILKRIGPLVGSSPGTI